MRDGNWKYQLLAQPDGWFGNTISLNMPRFFNLRQDPYERSFDESFDFFMSNEAPNLWRAVYLQEMVGDLAQTFIEYPPMQTGASFNLDGVKAQVQAAMENHPGN